MRPIADLLDFLQTKMRMQEIYQPVVILHLLTRDGFSTRAHLAQTLSGYDDAGLEFWDRVLMDNPKRWLVGKHQIVNYDKDRRIFELNIDLQNTEAVAQAQNLCEQAVLTWIQDKLQAGKLEEAEVLRLYRVLELARQGEAYGAIEPETDDMALEEFAFRVAVEVLKPRFPQQKMIQQPYNTVGFNLLVGTVADPAAFVNVKATQRPSPVVYFSEGERRFSHQQAKQYMLLVIYAIDLQTETYQVACVEGTLAAHKGTLLPQQWQMKIFT